MNVLVACECSQIVMSAFKRYNNFAVSCDLKRTNGSYPGFHYVGDCFDLIDAQAGDKFLMQDGSTLIVPKWDLLVAHPPCTFLSSAGLYLTLPMYDVDGSRCKLRDDAVDFFLRLAYCNIPHRCIENPRGYINKHVLKHSQEVYPYYFGDRTVKRTDFWLFNLPFLYHTSYVKPQEKVRIGNDFYNPFFSKTRGMRKSARQAVRSVFFPGIADAMASQWNEQSLILYGCG